MTEDHSFKLAVELSCDGRLYVKRTITSYEGGEYTRSNRVEVDRTILELGQYYALPKDFVEDFSHDSIVKLMAEAHNTLHKLEEDEPNMFAIADALRAIADSIERIARRQHPSDNER